MERDVTLWERLTTLSPDQRKAKAIEILRSSTSPQTALKAAKRLVSAWPYSSPPDPEGYAAALAAALAGYPLGIVEECCDPRTGLARVREYAPTVASIVEWCDNRMIYHRKWSNYRHLELIPVDLGDNHAQS